MHGLTERASEWDGNFMQTRADFGKSSNMKIKYIDNIKVLKQDFLVAVNVNVCMFCHALTTGPVVLQHQVCMFHTTTENLLYMKYITQSKNSFKRK